MAKLDYSMFYDNLSSLFDAYILRIVSEKISEGLQGQVRVILIYAPWSRDRRGVGWTYTGSHLWWGAQQKNLRPSGPQRIDFVLCN